MTVPAPERDGGDGPGDTPARVVSGRVDRLVLELQQHARLTEVDAHRAAFIALALARGWSKARIARYLGISRARVGQKVEKLMDYDYEHGRRTPTLRAAVRNARVAKPVAESVDSRSVQFDQDDWEHLEFARRLCDMVA